jgi:hypothetical protein
MRAFLISIFVLSVPAFWLSGCSDQDPFRENYLQAEEHYLQREFPAALNILEPLVGQEGLPDRYFRLLTRVYLDFFQFHKAVQTVELWEKKTGESKKAEQERVLLSWLRYFSEFEDKGIKFEAIRALGELRDMESKNMVMGYFEEKSRVLRLVVCYAMCLLGDEERALPYLLERSKYASLDSRFMAAYLLQKLEKPGLDDHYLGFLDDVHVSVQVIGLSMVRRFKLFGAKDTLVRLFEETVSRNTRMLIAQTLISIGEPRYEDFLQESMKLPEHELDARLMLFESGRSEYFSELREDLDTMNYEQQFSFFNTLIKRKEQLDYVRSIMKMKLESFIGDTFEKKIALEILPQIADREDLALVSAQLNSPFEEVQLLAIKALILMNRSL